MMRSQVFSYKNEQIILLAFCEIFANSKIFIIKTESHMAKCMGHQYIWHQIEKGEGLKSEDLTLLYQ